MLRKKIITTGLLIFGLILVCRIFTGAVKIDSAYQDGQYILDNRKTNISPKHFLLVGNHQLIVRVEDMEEKIYQFKISPLKTTILKINDLRDAYQDIDEGIRPEMLKRYELIQKLPMTVPFGKVEHIKETDTFAVTLYKTHTQKEALDWFRRNGVILSKDNISWH